MRCSPVDLTLGEDYGRHWVWCLMSTESTCARRMLAVEIVVHLGMDVSEWPPENIEELAKKHEDQY